MTGTEGHTNKKGRKLADSQVVENPETLRENCLRPQPPMTL